MMEKDFGIPQLSTGDIIRLAIQNQTEWGRKAEEFVKAGKLVPDEVVIGIVKEKLSGKDLANGFILDGFPRTLPQAEALEEMLRELGIQIDAVLYFQVDSDEIVRRLSARRICEKCQTPYNLLSKPPKNDEICDQCGGKVIQRPDDRPEVVRERLRVYEEQTSPLVEFYSRKGLLRVIPSNGSIEEVYERVKEVLKR
jgi:adenylate kinase